MKVKEINKLNGLVSDISFEEASHRLMKFYGRDVSYALKCGGIMQTSFVIFKIKEE